MRRSTLPPLIFAVFAFACLCYVATAGARPAQGPRRLFDPSGAERPTAKAGREQSAASAGAVREQEIRIRLGAAEFAGARELSLPLFGGISYTAVRSESEGFAESKGGGLVWRGKIPGPGPWGGDVTLSAKGRALSGLIYSPEGVYEIVPQKDFTHLLVKIDQSLFPACGGALDARTAPETEASDATATTSTADKSSAASAASAASDDGRVIDVLVAYTAAVRTALGGTTQAEAFAQQAIDSTNTAYINSDIHTRLRLAGTLEVAYKETSDLSAALRWARDDATVRAARNGMRGDMVALLVETSGNCGVGFLMTRVSPDFAYSAFSVTSRRCAVGNLSFAHELGHNQGCHHNPENADPPETLSYPYAYGHYVDGAFRTIMSYSDPCSPPGYCPRVQHFSNPSVNFNGVPTGIPDQRDTHRVINSTAPAVSQFRESFVAAPPANDHLADALAIGGAAGALLGSNNGATKETGEPNHGLITSGGASVWYVWQAPASGPATITTAESTFNTLLSVYTGGVYGGLQLVAYSDDARPLVVSTSSVTFNAAEGTTYRIGVDGHSGATGNVTLNWKMALPADAALFDPDFFVRQHYHDFLGRVPDADGLGFWTGEIAACGGDPQCVEVKRINVSAAFFLSIEFQQTGFLAYRLQQSSFGTRPTFAPFMADARQVAQGLVVGRPGWQDALESNKAAFVEVWVQRPAFLVDFPTGMTAQEYVSKLSQRAGVALTGAEFEAAVSAYGGGDVRGRAGALRAVVESQTVTRAHRNAAYVLMEYFGYLRRDPDEEGFQFWLAKLNAFDGDAVPAEMVKAFLTSVEYRQRFGS